MSTALAALPTSSDQNVWNPEERALVEAAGLVHTDAKTGQKTLAERATVAAFLQHCSRTGLDPIARQIYSIARKSKGQLKWQIQISIDGARLVAERSGQYEGQTTPEFTADGVTWTQVWLSKEFPAAARVGVYRRGFREPLYAVALWDAYVQTTYNGDVTEMWRKMGPLMLAKCAEMLALRKAFPQDLSGLYSAEEMSQATAPTEQPVQARQEPEQRPVQQPVQEQSKFTDEDVERWFDLAAAASTVDELGAIWAEAQGVGGLRAEVDGTMLGSLLKNLKERFEQAPVEVVEDAEVVEDEPVTSWDVAPIPNGEQA